MTNFIPRSPQQFNGTVQNTCIRASILRSWNYPTFTPKIGPFRAARNAGDLLSRKNYSCGGPNPIHSHPQLHGLNNGKSPYNCDGSGVPSHKGGKYVVDASEYLRFKKEAAILSNFYDSNNGGNMHNATQSVIRLIRHSH
jgi:hypothetical protein